MKREETPHIKRNLDGSLEFYELEFYKTTTCYVLNIIYLLFTIAVIYLYHLSNGTIKISLSLFLILIFFLPLIFATIRSYMNKTPLITLSPTHIKIKNHKYLYQDISKICYYTKNYSDDFFCDIFFEEKNYLIFYFSTKIKKIAISNLNENDRKILLEKLKEYKEIDRNKPLRITNIRIQYDEENWLVKWMRYRMISMGIFIVFIVLYILFSFINIFTEIK